MTAGWHRDTFELIQINTVTENRGGGGREQRVFVGISVATKLQGLMDSNVNPVNNLCGITFCLRQPDCENIQRTCWLAAGSWHSHPSSLGSLGGHTIISLKSRLHRGGKCLLRDHEDWPGNSSTAWENWCRGKDRLRASEVHGFV